MVPKETMAAMTKRLGALKSERGVWESHWQECQNFCKPRMGDVMSRMTPGTKFGKNVFDGTPTQALNYLAAGLSSFLTSSTNKWFNLALNDKDLNAQDDIKEWLQANEKRITECFNQSNFYLEITEVYTLLGHIGTGPMYVEDMGPWNRPLNRSGVNPLTVRFEALPIRDVIVAENAWGMIDTVFETPQLQARNVVAKFGEENCPPAILKRAQERPDDWLDIIHAVGPRVKRMPWSDLTTEAPFYSIYYVPQTMDLLMESGHYDFPYVIPRWAKNAGETYGRSPAMDALADVKMLNQMSASNIKAAQRVADPSLLMPHNSVVGGVRNEPGQITYIRWDTLQRGFRPGPLVTGAQVPIALELEEKRREMIRAAFFTDLFLLLLERPQMTATEVVQRNDEKMALLAPVLGRLMTEMLNPLIKRVWGILGRSGQLIAPPMDLSGKQIVVEYVSPLARAQKLWEARAIQDTIAFIAPLAQVYPDIWDKFESDEIVETAVELYGAPRRVIRSKERLEELRQAKIEGAQQAQQFQQGMALADAMAKLNKQPPPVSIPNQQTIQ